MEQQVTTADRLYVLFLVNLAESALGKLLENIDPEYITLSDADQTIFNEAEATQRETFEEALEVLRKFNLY